MQRDYSSPSNRAVREPCQEPYRMSASQESDQTAGQKREKIRYPPGERNILRHGQIDLTSHEIIATSIVRNMEDTDETRIIDVQLEIGGAVIVSSVFWRARLE